MTWRYGILDKLYKWGVKGRLPLVIKSFLMNPTFKVKMGNTLSDQKILENGIPQGSTLSCSLFAIAINDISKGLQQNISTCLYVDDLAIFYSAKTIEEAVPILQTAINNIVSNGEKIGFSFSQEKTKCVHFCRHHKPHNDPVLSIKGRFIACVEHTKFLGLTFDKKLT